jgi:hypothetical protein
MDDIRMYGSALSAEQIVQDMSGQVVSGMGLIFNYDGSTEGSKLADISGNDYHGTLFGGVTVATNGQCGNLPYQPAFAEAEGADDHVSASSSNGLNGSEVAMVVIIVLLAVCLLVMATVFIIHSRRNGSTFKFG